MTSTPASELVPALASRRGFLRAPVDGASWRALAQLTVGWVWLLAVGLSLGILVTVSAALVPALGIGLPMLVGCLALARPFATAERARLYAQTGVLIPPPAPREPSRPGWWAATTAVLRDGRSWAAVGYACAAWALVTLLVTLVVTLAGGAAAGVVLTVRLARGDVAGIGALGWPFAVALGVVVIVAALWCAAVLAQYGSYLLVRFAGRALGPSAADVVRVRAVAAEQRAQASASVAETALERADVLTETRSQAVAAADAERRRIERDLHDGAQQRLVALGVELGLARRRAEQDPASAVAALTYAHGEVKETLTELRDLVRGIHPAVLADRGLDAALSALAARSPVPVRVEASSDVSTAADSRAQAAAYFVVAEALTNVAKHAGATRAEVTAEITNGTGPRRLRVVVSDDGRGGADLAAGTGLTGLRGRVAALDGDFELTSPPGAGTRIVVEVPCAS